MITINLNTNENIKTFNFPDGQPHVNIDAILTADWEPDLDVKVICSITSTDMLIKLAECANAIHNAGRYKKMLVIPYLMGARFDRIMQPGDSFDLEVIAKIINDCKFEMVYLYDVHSKKSCKLINNAYNVNNSELVESYQIPGSVLIIPDKGAETKAGDYFHWNKNLVDTVHCDKVRDLSTGRITLKVLEPEKCKDRNCVIIDDLCDGGGTFLAIASQIEPAHLTLIVTHGIFSQGFDKLIERFDQIIVSDSYPFNYIYDSSFIKIIPFTL